MRSHSSVGAPTTGPSSITPALLITTSSRPSSATARSTAAIAWPWSVTSVSTATARPPSAAIAATSASSRSVRRAATATAAPCPASARAAASPMPLLAPVTSATVPSSVSVMPPDYQIAHCYHAAPYANDLPARAQGTPSAEEEARHPRPEVGQGSQEEGGCSSAPRRVHARVHDDPQEAELGSAQGLPRAADQPDGGHRVHPRRGPQPAGALRRARPRRPRQGPAGRAVQGRARHARRRRRLGPQEGPLAVRREGQVMPRRSAATIRPVEPDPLHRSKLVQQVINRVMLDGKKSTAERIVYDALAILAERTGKDPV